jgi:hypothetical protein
MIKKILMVGLVIFLLGTTMMIGGYITVVNATNNIKTDDTVHFVNTGEYMSGPIYYSPGDVLIISGSGKTYGLVNENKLGNVTRSNISEIDVAPSQHTGTNGYEYTNLKEGSYVFVMFNSSKPTNFGYALETQAQHQNLIIADYAFSIGIGLLIVGIIIAIIGGIIKPRKKVPLKTILKK